MRDMLVCTIRNSVIGNGKFLKNVLQSGGIYIMAKAYEELELQDDFMFGVIMRDPKYCKPFLETILGIKIRKLEYPESQKTIDLSAGAKGVRLDVYVEDEKNTVFDMEMQVHIKRNLAKRMRYYQGMIDLNILEKGGDYNELKKSYVIFICTFDPYGQGRHLYSFEYLCDQDPSLTFGDETVKIILNTKGTMDDVSPEMKRLLEYIDGQTASDEFTRELDDAVQSARRNEKWRLEYMTLQQEYREKYNEGLEVGKAEGKIEGRMEGKLEGKIEILYCEFKLTISEIAQKLELSEEYVQGVVKHLT